MEHINFFEKMLRYFQRIGIFKNEGRMFGISQGECEYFFPRNVFDGIFDKYNVVFKYEGCESFRCWYTYRYFKESRHEALIYRYQVTDNEHRSVLHQECCAEHAFIRERDIIKVVHFSIKKAYRNQGLMKSFFKKSIEAFKVEGYKIVTLDAICDGIVVWPRLGFKFINSVDEMSVNYHLRNYLTKRGKKVDDSVHIATVDSALLKEEKEPFSTYLQSQGDFKDSAIGMYYEIS